MSVLVSFSNRIAAVSGINALQLFEGPLRDKLEHFATSFVANLSSIVLIPSREVEKGLRKDALGAFWTKAASVASPASPSFSGQPNALRCPSWKAWYLDPYDIDEQ